MTDPRTDPITEQPRPCGPEQRQDGMSAAMLARIRKLLAKAEDPATTAEEAETYTAKAAELVAAYGIDRALLAGRDPATDAVGDRVVVLDPPYSRDKGDLLAAVASALRCQVVQRRRWVEGTKELSLHLFGFGSDLERAELLYTSLLLQAGGLMGRAAVPPGEQVAAYRRSWLAGFTRAVGQRLREAERRAEQARQAGTDAGHVDAPERRAAGSLALVLADRSARVEQAVQREYPALGRARPRTLSGSGARSGWAAGQRADLGGTRVGGGRRALRR